MTPWFNAWLGHHPSHDKPMSKLFLVGLADLGVGAVRNTVGEYISVPDGHQAYLILRHLATNRPVGYLNARRTWTSDRLEIKVPFAELDTSLWRRALFCGDRSMSTVILDGVLDVAQAWQLIDLALQRRQGSVAA